MVAELETDKSSMEILSTANGTIKEFYIADQTEMDMEGGQEGSNAIRVVVFGR